MIKEDLIRMVNDINDLCNIVEQETTEIKRQRKQVIKENLKNYHHILHQYIDLMLKAGLREFSYLTDMKGTGYGAPAYLVIETPGCINFCEPGRVGKWCYSRGISKEKQLAFYDKHFDDVEMKLSKEIMKAMVKRAENVIKENEEVKNERI